MTRRTFLAGLTLPFLAKADEYQMARIPLVGPSAAIDPLAAAASECINLYPEAIEDPDDRAKNMAILRGVPGIHEIIDLGLGSIRGMWSGGGRLFVVHSNTLYEIGIGTYIPGNPSTGTGSIISSHALSEANLNNQPAQIFANASGSMIAIVANGYVMYSTGGAVSTATFSTGGKVTAITGAVLGDCLFVNQAWGGVPDVGRQVVFSAPDDFTSWDALDFKSKESSPDYIQAIYSDRGQLYVMGTEGSEVWQLDPNTGLPVAIPGAEAKEGLVARWSVVSLAQSVFFLGGSPRGQTIAYRLRGFTPVRVSTHAVEKSWGSIGSFAQSATSFSYIGSNGHQFWVINSLAPVNTWVYDVTASDDLGYPVWHQRASWDAGGFWYESKTWFHTFLPEWDIKGMHVGGGYGGGKLYEISDDFYDDNGDDIKWVRAIPYRYNGGKKIFFGRQTIEAECGTITREFSDDNGATFEHAEEEMGNGTTRRFWPQGGSSENRIWRFSGIGQEKVTLIDLQGEERKGTA